MLDVRADAILKDFCAYIPLHYAYNFELKWVVSILLDAGVTFKNWGTLIACLIHLAAVYGHLMFSGILQYNPELVPVNIWRDKI